MPTYEYTGPETRKGNPTAYSKGEEAVTVAGSFHDQRLAASGDWKPVDEPAKQAAKQADDDGS